MNKHCRLYDYILHTDPIDSNYSSWLSLCRLFEEKNSELVMLYQLHPYLRGNMGIFLAVPRSMYVRVYCICTTYPLNDIVSSCYVFFSAREHLSMSPRNGRTHLVQTPSTHTHLYTPPIPTPHTHTKNIYTYKCTEAITHD